MDNYQSFPDYDSPQTSPVYGEPPKPRTNRTILIIVGVLLFLCCCCVGLSVLFYFVLGDIITDEMGITQLLVTYLAL